MAIVEVDKLVKRYKGARTNAVDGVSFSIEAGEFFAMLGPNGAGKTTTISILTTTLAPTDGSVLVNGRDVSSQASQVRRDVGIIFQRPSLDLNLTAEENVLRVTGADEVELLLVAASNVESWKSLAADPAKQCQAMLGAAAARDYATLRQRHLADHQALFRRVDLDLGRTPAAALPTDERLAAFASGDGRFVRMIVDFMAQVANRSENVALDVAQTALTMMGAPSDIIGQLRGRHGDVTALEIVFAATALWALKSNAREHQFVERVIAGYVTDNPGTLATKALSALAPRR